MSLLSRLASLRGWFWWRSFDEMAARPEEAQRDLLRRILATNQDTAFGRHHGFSRLASVEAYQSSVPIEDYEAFRPWVERVEAGERRVLTAAEPYMFTRTSGTTGEPKLIPVNAWARRSSSRLSAMWLYRALADHPGTLDHKALVLVSPAVEGHTPGGIPFGSASGYIYERAPWAIRRVYAVPGSVLRIKDFDAKYYVSMRFAVEQRVSLIATPNPSTILRLVTTAENRRESLIRDIRDGSISNDLDIPLEVRRELQGRLKPNPTRALELDRLASKGGSLVPRDYWPDLRLVGCWKGGSVGVTVHQLRPWFRPDMPFRDIGYLASEAQMTLPIHDDGCAGVLALDANFYEFVPEAELGSDNARPLTVGQVDVGATYYIIITTPAGLYRYDINDVVKVTGYHRRTPLIEFVRKGRDMVSLVGEKLHVGQLIEAVEAAQRETGVEIQSYRAVGNVDACRYDLKLELKGYPIKDELLLALGRAVDGTLASLNLEYEQKRLSGRLHPPALQVMPAGWFDERVRARLMRGARDVQFKDSLLGLPDEEDRSSEVVKELILSADPPNRPPG